MVVLNKIYTRTGDDGTTALGSGDRVVKFSPRIEAYGTVDETNAAIGVARLELGDQHGDVDGRFARPRCDAADTLVPSDHAAFTYALMREAHLGDRPQVNDLLGAIKIMLDAYEEGRIDRLFLLHNEFVSAMSQKPVAPCLLPVSEIDLGDESLQEHWDYIYEPDAGELLADVLMRYIESQVYRGAVENFACEMAAKMVAMKSATDNAGEIIDTLQLQYNKARQAAITQEISEIVGGAAAVSG